MCKVRFFLLSLEFFSLGCCYLFELLTKSLGQGFKQVMSPHHSCWSKSPLEGPRLHREASGKPGCWLSRSQDCAKDTEFTGVWSEASVDRKRGRGVGVGRFGECWAGLA